MQTTRTRRKRFQTLIALTATATLLAACGGDDDDAEPPAGVQTFDNLSRTHVEGDLDYPQSPPVGGDHSAVWQTCGVYREPVLDENAVHSLEHGGVWIAYGEDVAAGAVTTLEGKADGQSHVLVTPYPGLAAEIVLTAWGNQLRVESADDPAIDQFVDAFQEGPQTPEPDTRCSGGVGEPITP